MGDQINVAVVGFGYWGPNLVRNFRSLTQCRVRYVCDADAGRLAHMKGLYPEITGVADFKTVLADPEVDAVVVATPVRFHFDLAHRSLMAGKHVFIEKPMAASVMECARLVDVAEKSRRTLMVGHAFLYSAPVRRIKEIIASGELGDLLYMSARRLNLGLFQTDINVAWDLAPHDIAIMLYIVGAAPANVTCFGRSSITEGIEDMTSMALQFPGGEFAVIQSSWLDPNKVRDMTFVGAKKMLVYNDMEPTEKIKIYDKRIERPPYYDTFGEFHYSYHYGDAHCPYVKLTEPLRVECEHFIECIRNGATPLSDGRNGMDVVQVLEQANYSLRHAYATRICPPAPAVLGDDAPQAFAGGGGA